MRWVAVAGSDAPTHAVDATAGLERSVKSLLAHRTYIEALTDEDPEAYCRTFLTDHARAEGSVSAVVRPSRSSCSPADPGPGSTRNPGGACSVSRVRG